MLSSVDAPSLQPKVPLFLIPDIDNQEENRETKHHSSFLMAASEYVKNPLYSHIVV